ncbi:hypothetical protein M5689_006352 [Euphorbia peplus]|nr:hypothetical protein M5689_006352 [Euphorbia peplus]
MVYSARPPVVGNIKTSPCSIELMKYDMACSLGTTKSASEVKSLRVEALLTFVLLIGLLSTFVDLVL